MTGFRAALLLSSLCSAPAFAGMWHAREYDATVVSARIVKSYELEDPFFQDDDDRAAAPKINRKERVCRAKVRIEDAYFRGREYPLIGSPALCDQLCAGRRYRVQYFGLAHMFRVVSIRLGEHWYALPRMRETANGAIASCLAGSGEDTALENQCKKARHERSL